MLSMTDENLEIGQVRALKGGSNEYIDGLEKIINDTYVNTFFPAQYDENWDILLTIRYDPSISDPQPLDYDLVTQKNFWLLEEHFQRLKFTVDFFKFQFNLTLNFDVDKDVLFDKLVASLKDSGKSPLNSYKFRLLVNLNGNFKVEIHDIPQILNLLQGLLSSVPTCLIYIDKEPTKISPFTSFKTTNRAHYTNSRNRSLPSNAINSEVLIYNTLFDVMEGSITNIAIRRKSDNTWITPPLSSGCLCGVVRHFLLRKNYIEEERILLLDLYKDQEILLFNGIMGVFKGTIVG